MKTTDDPCQFCENWFPVGECEELENCPVEALKRENRELKEKVRKQEYDASWDREIRRSHPDRDF